MSNILSFPSVPGRTLATIEIVRRPDGSIAGRLVDMCLEEIEASDTIAERFEKVASWLQPVIGSLNEQAASFKEPLP